MATPKADAAVHEAPGPQIATPDLQAHVFHGTAEGLAAIRASDGVILDANDAFLRLSGLSRDAAVGASSFALGLWGELGDEASARAALLEHPWLEDLMTSIVGPNGTVTSMRISAEAIPGRTAGEEVFLVRATHPGSFVRSSERFRVLREAEARYRSLVEQLPAIVYTQIADGESPTGYRDVYISQQTEAKLGYSAAEWQADPLLWQKVTYIEDLDAVLREEDRTVATGEPFSSTYRMVARDGRLLWFRDDAVLVQDPDTGLSLWKGVMLDITDQKRAEEQLLEAEARYRALIERIPAMVYHTEFTPEGSWLYVSPQVKSMLGLSPEEWMAHPHPMSSFCHPEDLPRVREAEERSHQTGEPFREEYRMRTPFTDGWRWMLDEAAVVRGSNGRPLHLLGMMFDMTERKRAEEALRDALQREKDASDRLRTMDALKSTLLHTLSHDLKSPLTAIHTAAATMQQLGEGLTRAQHRDLVETIMSRSRKMNELLSDLLDLDRLDRGIVAPNLRDEDLASLVRRIVADFDHLDGRPLTVRADQDVVLALDRTKIERIVENLLGNAVRHTPRGTPICLSVERRHDGAILAVDDEGPGVPDELKEAIFEEFRRGPDAGAKGAGIGLSLVSRFAALHGGRAWVEDRPGGGAAFRVFLPTARGRA